MRSPLRLSRAFPRSLGAAGVAVISVTVAAVALAGTTSARAQTTAVAPTLGVAGSFAVLGGSGLTNSGTSTVGGDVGTFPTPAETGFSPCPAADCVVLTGTNEAANAVSQQGKADLTAAYNTLAGQAPTGSVAADLGGQRLTPGVYNSASALSVTGPLPLTLDGGGNSAAVFIFQAGTTLTTGSGSSIALINGAQSCHVFWQVGTSATLGSGSVFRGTIAASASISVGSAATVDGRLLAGEQASGTGAVTLIGDTIDAPACAAGATPTSPTPTATASSTLSATPTPTLATASPTGAPSGGAAPTSPTPTATASSTLSATPTSSTLATSSPAVTPSAPRPTATTTVSRAPAATAGNASGAPTAGTTGTPTAPTGGQGASLTGSSSSLTVNAGGGAGSTRPLGPAVQAGAVAAAVTFGVALMASELRRRRRSRQ